MEVKDTLYIYGGRETIAPDQQNLFTYSLLSGTVTGEGNEALENGKALHCAALNLKEDYVGYIYSMNKIFLEDRLVFRGSISSFFFTDLSNKRTEVFGTFLTLCHLSVIEQAIKESKVNTIIFDTCHKAFEVACRSRFSDLRFICRNPLKNEKEYIPLFLQQLKFLTICGLKLLMMKRSMRKEPLQTKIDSLFFSIYPLLLTKKFVDEKYGDFVKEGDVFLVSMLTDGMHQRQNLAEFKSGWKALTGAPRHIFLDSYIHLTDLFRTAVLSVRMEYNLRKLCRRHFIFAGTDLTPYFRKELKESFRRLPRLFMYEKPLIRVFTKFRVTRFIYYLHEFSFGRFFTFLLKDKFTNVTLAGFQHGPAARRKLLYCLAPGEIDNGERNWLLRLPAPDVVYAEDFASQQIYMDQGYPDVRLMERIYRLDYLREIRKDPGAGAILIVPGLHDGTNLLHTLKKEIESNSETTYIFKPHPRAQIFNKGLPSQFEISNLILGDKHISTYLPISKEVIVTYSSVGYESWKLGIPVRLVCLPDRINESPLLDYAESGETDKIRIQWDNVTGESSNHSTQSF